MTRLLILLAVALAGALVLAWGMWRATRCLRGQHVRPAGFDGSWLSWTCLHCGCVVSQRAFRVRPFGLLARLIWRGDRWECIELRPIRSLGEAHPRVESSGPPRGAA